MESQVREKKQKSRRASCRCGTVTLEVVGAPLVTATCYCASCQEAGRRIERCADAPPLLGADGGTDFVLYRKDRIRCMKGRDFLREHRLKPGSPTRRVVAACCNSAMFLEFTKGHWLSLYRNRLGGSAPRVEMRVMTRDRREDVTLSDDLPNYAGHSGRLMWKLLTSRMAMGLSKPGAIGEYGRHESLAN